MPVKGCILAYIFVYLRNVDKIVGYETAVGRAAVARNFNITYHILYELEKQHIF